MVIVSKFDLAPAQNERFCQAFRELRDRLPIHSAEKVISIDSLRRSAYTARIEDNGAVVAVVLLCFPIGLSGLYFRGLGGSHLQHNFPALVAG
jgi:hypothetical protein